MWFPIDTETASLQNGVWEIDFPSSNSDRVLQWIALLGPAGSSVKVFLNTVFIDTTPRGDFNRADYYKGMPIARGQTLRLVWNIGTGSPTPSASIGCTDGIDEVSANTSGNPGIFTPASYG